MKRHHSGGNRSRGQRGAGGNAVAQAELWLWRESCLLCRNFPQEAALVELPRKSEARMSGEDM